MSSKKREMSESGMFVYPPLPVPKGGGGGGRESAPKLAKKSGGGSKLVLPLVVIALLGGAAGGFFARPHVLEDARVVEAQSALAKEKLATAEARATIARLQDESKTLDEQRDLLNKQLEAAKQAQDMLAATAADASKRKAALEAAKKKLDAAGAGAAVIVGDEVRLSISTSSLFKTGDELTPGGMKVLDRVAAALKDLADKQVAVHGHTDDQPPPKPAPPAAAKPAKPVKGKKPAPAPEPPPAAPVLATNWEVSSARALAVVHYLQDTHKIDGTRLSASAFSQYRPVSKTKASNRRIELVLTPKPAKK